MIEKHKTLSETFLKKGFWLYLFSFIIAPIWYIIKITITWNITVEEVWILYAIISFVWLLSSFNDFWMTESLNYFLPKYIEEKNYSKVKTLIAYAFITQMTTWVIISLFLFFWADYLAIHHFHSEKATEILKIFCLYFLWINIFQVFNSFFLIVQNTFYNKITEFARMSFILISVLLTSYLNIWNIVNFAFIWMAWLYFWITIVLFLFYTRYYKKYLAWINYSFSKKLFKKIFNYAIIVFIAAQASSILSQMDMQMIVSFLGSKEAWYYTAYLSIISIPVMLIWPIFWLLFPLFSQLNAQKNYKKIKLVKQIMQKNFIWVAIAFNILFFIFAKNIVYILFWQNYIKSWIILQYSILFLIFNFLLQINFSILASIWKIKERLKIIVFALIFNAIANIILINSIWVEWAALATWMWWFLIWLLSEIKLWKKFISKFNYSFFSKNILILWFLWFLSHKFLIPLFEWISRWKSFWLFVFISIIWFIIFWLINYKDFKNFIWEIKKLKKWN